METSGWGEDSPGATKSLGGMRQECKPDYEGMINELREKLKVTTNFLQSCENFILHGPHILNKGKLKDLIGHLHVEIQEKQATLEKLMEQAEKEV